MPCGSPDGTHENNQPRAWTAKCGVEPSSEVWPGAREHSCVGTRRGARWRVHVIDSAGEYGPTSRPFPIDVVPRFTPLSREAQSTPQARSRVQRVRFHDAARLPRLHLDISSSTQSPVTSSSVDAALRSSHEPLGGVCHRETFINLILFIVVSALENRVRTRWPPWRQAVVWRPATRTFSP